MYTYKTCGTCSRSINFDIVDGTVTKVNFVGGCDGNLSGISNLVEGRSIPEVVSALEGVTCGRKSTSCPDQLARALKLAMNGQCVQA